MAPSLNLGALNPAHRKAGAWLNSTSATTAIQQKLVPPDIFRLRHRQALSEVVSAIVRQGLAATEQTVKRMMPTSVPPTQQDHFIALVLAEFATLHAGNAVRFGLRPLEWSAWRNSGHS